MRRSALYTLLVVLLLGCDAPGVYEAGEPHRGQEIILRHDKSVYFASWSEESTIICEAHGSWTTVPDNPRQIQISLEDIFVHDIAKDCVGLLDGETMKMGFGYSSLKSNSGKTYHRSGL